MNITSKINLAKLQHAITKTAKGTDCIMIPLNQPGIYHAKEKGNVYLDTVTFINEQADEYGNNGAIALPKEKDSLDKSVYIGNCKIMGAANANAKPSTPARPAAPESIDEELPF